MAVMDVHRRQTSEVRSEAFLPIIPHGEKMFSTKSSNHKSCTKLSCSLVTNKVLESGFVEVG